MRKYDYNSKDKIPSDDRIATQKHRKFINFPTNQSFEEMMPTTVTKQTFNNALKGTKTCLNSHKKDKHNH